jgi:electron transport complex protein RnfC
MAGKKQYFNFQKYKFLNKKIAYIPETVEISMNQYGNNTCIPTVETGQIVKEGQVIGRGSGDSAAVHSSVPGVVAGFKYISIPDGKRSLAAVINMRGSFTYTGKNEMHSDWKLLSSSELITLFKNRGIINSFSYKPVSLAEQCADVTNKDKVLYVCLFDTQPDIFVDSFLTNSYPEKMIVGAEIIAKTITASKIVFFYSTEYSKLISSKLKNLLSPSVSADFIHVDITRYPTGVTNELIKAVCKTFPDKAKDDIIKNPAFCVESSTLCDVYDGVVLSKPVIDRIVQVIGAGLYNSKLFQVRIGTPIKDLIYECGGTRKTPGKIIINGLIQGIQISDVATPITKFVKSITLLEKKEIQCSTISSCIHCGRCHTVCPEELHPDRLFAIFLNNAKVSDEVHATKKWCSECGLCNTVCPSRLPLVQAISLIKEENND